MKRLTAMEKARACQLADRGGHRSRFFACSSTFRPLMRFSSSPAITWVHCCQPWRCRLCSWLVTCPSPARNRCWATACAPLLPLRVIVYVHFNLKLWAQLINPVLFDDVYMAADERLRSLVHFASALAAGYRDRLTHFPHAYHEVFVAMFVVSFTVHGMQSDRRGFDRLLLAVSLVLIVGGLGYAIAPAWGPFVYEAGDNPERPPSQTTMASFQQSLRASHGGNYDSSYFVAALAAMPSLHLAHAVVFLYFALRYIRWLGLHLRRTGQSS